MKGELGALSVIISVDSGELTCISEVFFDEDYMTSGATKSKAKTKKDYTDELPPPYPPTKLREKPKKKQKKKENKLPGEKVDKDLEEALVTIVKRLTVYGESRSGPPAKPKVRRLKKPEATSMEETTLPPQAKEKVHEKQESDEEKEEEADGDEEEGEEVVAAGRRQEVKKVTARDEETAQLRATLNEFLVRLNTLGIDDLTDEVEDEEEEAVDESQWKEEEEEEEEGGEEGSESVLESEFTMRKSGYSPLTHKEDNTAFKDLSDRIRAFYRKYDRVKLIEGIGHIVEW